MQDRYAGDLGDFLKLGLLRWLVAPSVDAAARRLGVVWYLTPDESHNADGKHVAYSTRSAPLAASFGRSTPTSTTVWRRWWRVVSGRLRSSKRSGCCR